MVTIFSLVSSKSLKRSYEIIDSFDRLMICKCKSELKRISVWMMHANQFLMANKWTEKRFEWIAYYKQLFRQSFDANCVYLNRRPKMAHFKLFLFDTKRRSIAKRFAYEHVSIRLIDIPPSYRQLTSIWARARAPRLRPFIIFFWAHSLFRRHFILTHSILTHSQFRIVCVAIVKRFCQNESEI